MGTLAARIAQGLEGALPRGWTAKTEAPLLPNELCARLGFRIQADLMLSGPAGERIVVELEISRADPIANPAKFFLALHTGTDGRTVLLRGTLKDLAAELGLTHEALYRALAGLAAKGEIKRSKNKIVLRDKTM